MSAFLIGLVIGLAAGAVVAAAFFIIRSGGMSFLRGARRGTLFSKVMVATVGRPFSPAAIALGSEMAGPRGVVETLFVLEVPIDKPLDAVAEPELSRGLDSLERAAGIGKKHGKLPVPRLEKSRLGSKTIVELQKSEGFDALVFSLHPGSRGEKEESKMADYIKEKAECTVIIVSEKEG